ncbi:hypothetical protein [Cupriavidus sp. DL-D2]|uniref:hypothetical protein n=1 Tax=Cupriavidus sp. DL-D2 TaxID=3144974 RepID=UPI003212AF25
MTVFDNHGLCCPHCGRDSNLRVEATVVAKLLPDGADTAGDLEWDDGSHVLCDTCGKEGTLGSFASREAKLARLLRAWVHGDLVDMDEVAELIGGTA